MQTSKARCRSSAPPQRTSRLTSRSNRLGKSGGSESDSATSTDQTTKSPTEKSQVIMHRPPRSLVPEKQKTSGVADLECRLAEIQEDLKKTKDQLGSSESCKRRAQKEEEETKKQLLIMSAKVEDSQCQLVELSAAEESRLQELRKNSQERNRAWQSEAESIQKQRSITSATLTLAMNEIQRLKLQLDMVVKSEAAQAKQSEIADSELRAFKQDMADTVSIVENLKVHLRDSENAEVEAQAMVIETKQQLNMAKAVADTLSSDGLKLMESLRSLNSELDESRAQENSLEEVVKKLQADQLSFGTPPLSDHDGDCVSHPQKIGCGSLEFEVEQLKSAIEAAEIKYLEEQTKTMVHIQSAYELVERMRIESGLRVAELESKLKNTKAEIVEFKAILYDKEREVRKISDSNKKLNAEKGRINRLSSELGQSTSDVVELTAKLMSKETARRSILEENEMLKSEIEKWGMDSQTDYDAAIAQVELARAKEQETLMRVESVIEEDDKSSRRAVSLSEELDATQTAKYEMEAESMRLKAQSEQWRKAAEAAAAVLITGNNARCVDSEYHSVDRKLMSSLFSDESDDDSPKKNNNNVMRRISGLLKKGQK